jgi:hypothetical protein
LNPNLSLFRRAFVNNLIAYTVDPRQFPDSDKFAQEAIDLIAMLRKEGDADAEDTLNALEDQAKTILKWIRNKQEKIRQEEARDPSIARKREEVGKRQEIVELVELTSLGAS